MGSFNWQYNDSMKLTLGKSAEKSKPTDDIILEIYPPLLCWPAKFNQWRGFIGCCHCPQKDSCSQMGKEYS